jgi:hypothetical protein
LIDLLREIGHLALFDDALLDENFEDLLNVHGENESS